MVDTFKSVLHICPIEHVDSRLKIDHLIVDSNTNAAAMSDTDVVLWFGLNSDYYIASTNRGICFYMCPLQA